MLPFSKTEIIGKCQNWKIKCDIFGNFQTVWLLYKMTSTQIRKKSCAARKLHECTYSKVSASVADCNTVQLCSERFQDQTLTVFKKLPKLSYRNFRPFLCSKENAEQTCKPLNYWSQKVNFESQHWLECTKKVKNHRLIGNEIETFKIFLS